MCISTQSKLKEYYLKIGGIHITHEHIANQKPACKEGDKLTTVHCKDPSRSYPIISKLPHILKPPCTDVLPQLESKSRRSIAFVPINQRWTKSCFPFFPSFNYPTTVIRGIKYLIFILSVHVCTLHL